MRFRMMSARCCCGPGPTPGCDPITGANDTFSTSTIDPKWTVSQTIYETISIYPLGTLRIVNGSPFFDGLFKLSRCAIYDTRWDELPSLARSDNATWQIIGSYELMPGRADPGDFIPGIAVYGSFPIATGQKTYSLSHGLKFFTGIGWKQRLSFLEPGLASPFTVDLADVVQVDRLPYPIGPFAINIDLRLDRRQIGAQAGTWTAAGFFNESTLFTGRDIVTPTCSQTNFDHGFASEIGNYLADTKIDSWFYFP